MLFGSMNVNSSATNVPAADINVIYEIAEEASPSLPFSAVSTSPVAMPVATPENRPCIAKYIAEFVTPVFFSSSAASCDGTE